MGASGLLLVTSVAVASATYCGPGVRGQWSGAPASSTFRANPQCDLPTLKQLVTCIDHRRIHLVGDNSLLLPGQAIQSGFFGCRLEKGAWNADPVTGHAGPRVCQALHKNPDLSKRTWSQHGLGPMSLTYERADYAESVRTTSWWKHFVVGERALDYVKAAAAAEAIDGISGSDAPPPTAAAARLRRGASPSPLPPRPPERVPDAVVIGLYWWHAAHPRAPPRAAGRARAAADPEAAADAALLDFMASARSLISELVASPAWGAYWGAPGAGRVFWRLALPSERDFRKEQSPLLVMRRIQAANVAMRELIAEIAPELQIISQREILRHESAATATPGTHLLTLDGSVFAEPVQALLGSHLLMSVHAGVAGRLSAARLCAGRPLEPWSLLARPSGAAAGQRAGGSGGLSAAEAVAALLSPGGATVGGGSAAAGPSARGAPLASPPVPATAAGALYQQAAAPFPPITAGAQQQKAGAADSPPIVVPAPVYPQPAAVSAPAAAGGAQYRQAAAPFPAEFLRTAAAAALSGTPAAAAAAAALGTPAMAQPRPAALPQTPPLQYAQQAYGGGSAAAVATAAAYAALPPRQQQPAGTQWQLPPQQQQQQQQQGGLGGPSQLWWQQPAPAAVSREQQQQWQQQQQQRLWAAAPPQGPPAVALAAPVPPRPPVPPASAPTVGGADAGSFTPASPTRPRLAAGRPSPSPSALPSSLPSPSPTPIAAEPVHETPVDGAAGLASGEGTATGGESGGGGYHSVAAPEELEELMRAAGTTPLLTGLGSGDAPHPPPLTPPSVLVEASSSPVPVVAAADEPVVGAPDETVPPATVDAVRADATPTATDVVPVEATTMPSPLNDAPLELSASVPLPPSDAPSDAPPLDPETSPAQATLPLSGAPSTEVPSPVASPINATTDGTADMAAVEGEGVVGAPPSSPSSFPEVFPAPETEATAAATDAVLPGASAQVADLISGLDATSPTTASPPSPADGVSDSPAAPSPPAPVAPLSSLAGVDGATLDSNAKSLLPKLDASPSVAPAPPMDTAGATLDESLRLSEPEEGDLVVPNSSISAVGVEEGSANEGGVGGAGGDAPTLVVGLSPTASGSPAPLPPPFASTAPEVAAEFVRELPPSPSPLDAGAEVAEGRGGLWSEHSNSSALLEKASEENSPHGVASGGGGASDAPKDASVGSLEGADVLGLKVEEEADGAPWGATVEAAMDPETSPTGAPLSAPPAGEVASISVLDADAAASASLPSPGTRTAESVVPQADAVGEETATFPTPAPSAQASPSPEPPSGSASMQGTGKPKKAPAKPKAKKPRGAPALPAATTAGTLLSTAAARLAGRSVETPPPSLLPPLFVRALDSPSVLPTAGGLAAVLIIACCATRCFGPRRGKGGASAGAGAGSLGSSSTVTGGLATLPVAAAASVMIPEEPVDAGHHSD